MAAPLPSRPRTRCEYDRLIEAGVLHEDDAVELVGGTLIIAEPKGTRHTTAVRLVAAALRAAFGEGWLVVVQDPIALDAESEPEPDVAIVPGGLRDYRDAHPTRPVLVVEVAESSLALDRHVKGGIYARAGLPDYWIVDVVGSRLEIHRDPMRDVSARFGWPYGTLAVLDADATVSPLARQDAHIAVADLLP